MNSTKVYPSTNLSVIEKTSQTNDRRSSKIAIILNHYVDVWHVLRALFAIICVLWFCYNATTLIHQYWQYNTILMMEYKPPNETDLPAFTVCGPFIATNYMNQELCPDIYRHSNFSTVEGMTAARDNLEQCAINKLTASEIFNTHSLSVDSLVKHCLYMPDTTRKPVTEEINCTDIVPVVSSIYEGRKCFTFLSQLNSTEAEYIPTKMVYERKPLIQIQINAKLRSNVNGSVGSIQKENVIGALHPPNIIPTHLDLNYFRIFPDSLYVLHFTKKFEFLLPPPYKTNCRQYYRSNDKGEKSRGDCLNNCVKRETFSVNNCAIYYGILTPDIFAPNERICNHTHQNYTNFVVARKKCMKYCQWTCVEQTYDVVADESFDPNMKLSGDTLIKIKSATHPYTYMYHQEEWTKEQFIGTIGGYGHIVLGLSAIKLFNLIVRFLSHFKCSVT